MDPFTLMSLAQGGIGIAQTIGSLFKKDERPTYEMPNALKQSLALANAQVGARMPGYTQATDQANMVAANQLSAASQSGNALEAVQTIAGSQQGAMRDIAQMDAQSERQDIANLQQTLSQVAQAQDQQFMANEMAPFQDSSQEKRDLMGAGMENIFGAMNLYAVGGSPMKKRMNSPQGNSPADVMRVMPGMFSVSQDDAFGNVPVLDPYNGIGISKNFPGALSIPNNPQLGLINFLSKSGYKLGF